MSTVKPDRFAVARKVADAVLYEGYVLYPYRASACKNQLRWQFGVVTPRQWAELDGSERWTMRTEIVVDPGAAPRLHARVRCLQVQHREVERALDGGERFVPAGSVDVDGVEWVAWDEAVEHEIDLDPIRLLPLADATCDFVFSLPAGDEIELLRASSGGVVGRAVRHRDRVDGVARVSARWADGTGALIKLTITVENASDWCEPGAERDKVVRHSLVAVHTLLAIEDGSFVSLLDPPADARDAVAGCHNEGTFPVLIGAEGSTEVVLSSPIILYDHPAVAPESEGDFCDATEIDEILALRVLTLTDAEKAEARGTDPRAAAIVDRCDNMPPEVWARLHGVVRALSPIDVRPPAGEPAAVPWWDPGVDAEVDPWTDTTWIAGVKIGKGSKVRLRPSHRADAHDLFLAGLTATVAGVFKDVDGGEHLAVTIDDDPAADDFDWQGRYRYFYPDEVEVLSGVEAER